MSNLIEQIKTILGFRLGFPNGVNINLNKVILDLKLVKN